MISRDAVRAALRELSTEQIVKGMRAFEHPPRNSSHPQVRIGDSSGCFVYEASGRAVVTPGYTLSLAYEGYGVEGYELNAFQKNSAWFKSECIRELAERGVAIEPPATHVVPA